MGNQASYVTEYERVRIKNNRFEDIEFNGEIYKCRVMEDKDGEKLLIGSYGLESELHPGEWEDELEGFASKEAEEVYNKIFFFMNDWDLTYLSDEELKEELKESNPDWFD